MMADACALAERWILDPSFAARLAHALVLFEQRTGHGIEVISGHRTCEKQRQLAREGRPAAPCELSTHVACPATGADVRIGGFPARQLKLAFGEAALMSGLRWGGGSPVEEGIPSDWNHVDTGPRHV